MVEKVNSHTEAQGGHDAGGHGGGFPPFDGSTFASQLIWLAITFVALYLLMARVALPRIAAIFEQRRSHIDSDLAEASRLKGEADAAIAIYEKALADARVRAQTIATEARSKLAADSEKSRKALEDRLNQRLVEAEKSIAATKTAAMANVRGIAIEAAGAIVTRLTGVAVTDKAVSGAVDSVLKR